MGTSSIVGTIDTDTGAYRGRYVHFDGAPTSRIHVLAEVLTTTFAGDLQAMVHAMTEQHHGWSELSRHCSELAPSQQDGRFVIVPGIGVAYTNEQDGVGETLWHTGTLTPHSRSHYTEWTYLFTGTDSATSELIVAETTYIDGRDGLAIRGRIPVRDLTTLAPDALTAIECGTRYERCTHYAWYHFPEVPSESRGIGTSQWLGTTSMTPQQALEISIGGVRYTLSGSGRADRRWWHVSVTPVDGGPPRSVPFLRLTARAGIGAELAPNVTITRYPMTAAQLMHA